MSYAREKFYFESRTTIGYLTHTGERHARLDVTSLCQPYQAVIHGEGDLAALKYDGLWTPTGWATARGTAAAAACCPNGRGTTRGDARQPGTVAPRRQPRQRSPDAGGGGAHTPPPPQQRGLGRLPRRWEQPAASSQPWAQRHSLRSPATGPAPTPSPRDTVANITLAPGIAQKPDSQGISLIKWLIIYHSCAHYVKAKALTGTLHFLIWEKASAIYFTKWNCVLHSPLVFMLKMRIQSGYLYSAHFKTIGTKFSAY